MDPENESQEDSEEEEIALMITPVLSMYTSRVLPGGEYATDPDETDLDDSDSDLTGHDAIASCAPAPPTAWGAARTRQQRQHPMVTSQVTRGSRGGAEVPIPDAAAAAVPTAAPAPASVSFPTPVCALVPATAAVSEFSV